MRYSSGRSKITVKKNQLFGCMENHIHIYVKTFKQIFSLQTVNCKQLIKIKLGISITLITEGKILTLRKAFKFIEENCIPFYKHIDSYT